METVLECYTSFSRIVKALYKISQNWNTAASDHRMGGCKQRLTQIRWLKNQLTNPFDMHGISVHKNLYSVKLSKFKISELLQASKANCSEFCTEDNSVGPMVP